MIRGMMRDGADAAAGPAVELRDVCLTLGGRTVLRDVGFTIAAGEFVGVLGPNGAGKTTLMRALLGLVPVRSGTIHVLGLAAGRGRTAVGYMPQLRGGVFGQLSGREFVAAASGGHRWGLPVLSAAERQDVDRVLALVRAEPLARRPLAELSGGERQRLLLAQSLLGDPRLLLLDEPFISLDPHRQDEVVALVRRLGRELDITVLFSAHELNPLLGAMDRVLYLGGGAAAIGTVDEVITGSVLSRLYGTPIEVVRLGGRVFVMSGEHQVERIGDCAHGCAHAAGNAA